MVAPPSGGREWLTPAGLSDVGPLPIDWERLLAGGDQRLTGPALATIERAGAVEGSRNVCLAALVGRWLTQGHSHDDIARQVKAWASKCQPILSEAEALSVMDSIIRSRARTRSPEREALLLAKDYGLLSRTRVVLVALVAMHGELGLSGPLMFAPYRMVAQYSGVGLKNIRGELDKLQRAKIIKTSLGKDPSGKRVTVVQFLIPTVPGTPGLLASSSERKPLPRGALVPVTVSTGGT